MKALSNKKYWMIFIWIITALLLSMTMVNMSDARDNNINLILSENGESSPAIFDGNDPFLAPGININKKFDIQNKTKRSYYISGIKVNNFKLKDSNNSFIADSLKIDYFCEKVKCKIEKIEWINNQIYYETIYEGKLGDFVTQGGITMNNESLTISSGGNKQFAIEIGMDHSADNRLQGLNGNLDIQISSISKDNGNTGGSNTVVIGGITSLIKTGRFFDTTSLIGIGTLIVAIGIIIRIKKH